MSNQVFGDKIIPQDISDFQETIRPRLKRKDPDEVYIESRPAPGGTFRRVLQDGKPRYRTGTLTLALGGTPGDKLTFDTSSSRATNSWYSVQLAPDPDDDDLLTAYMTDNYNAGTGAPEANDEGANFEHIGWIRTNATGSGEVVDILQISDNEFYYNDVVIPTGLDSTTLGTTETAGINFSMANVCPPSATLAGMITHCDITGSAGTNMYQALQVVDTSGAVCIWRREYYTPTHRCRIERTGFMPLTVAMSGGYICQDDDGGGSQIISQEVYVQSFVDGAL